MSTLFFACRWWRYVDAPNREPGENPGLPRSGKQERTPIKALVLSGTGKPGLVESPIRRIGRACKSEDLPAATSLHACNCTSLRGEAGNGWQSSSCHHFPFSSPWLAR
jgi:hypothetical protein